MTSDLWPKNSLLIWQTEPMIAFLDWLAQQTAGPGTQLREASCDTYTAIFHTWIQFLHAKRMNLLEARPIDATEFFAHHTALVPVSRRRYLQLLDRVYAHLRELGWRLENPMGVELQKERKLDLDLPPGLLPEEQSALTNVLDSRGGWKGSRDRALCALLMGAGLRANEVVGLTPARVRTDYSIAVVSTTVHPDHVSILLPDGPWRAWYDAWVDQRRMLHIPGDRLTPSTLSGKPYSPSGLFRRTSSWFESAQITPKQRGPHILRNTFARNALASGRYSIQEVQQFLGHSEIRATARYTTSGASGEPGGEP